MALAVKTTIAERNCS